MTQNISLDEKEPTPKFQVGNLVGNTVFGWNNSLFLKVYQVTNIELYRDSHIYKVKMLYMFEKAGNDFDMKELTNQYEAELLESSLEQVQDIIYKFIEYFEKRKEFFSRVSEMLSQREMGNTTAKP